MNIIPRPRYIDRIRPYIGTKLIKAIIGQRRVGKSYILLQLAENLHIEHPDWFILYIDMEQLEWRHLRTGEDLVREVMSRIPSEVQARQQVSIALLLDEVQQLKHFETAVRGFAADDRFDVYISGSNADLLSSDIATLFAGRAISIEVFSLTYDEFLIFHRLEDSDEALNRFLFYGGLPFLANLPYDDVVFREYLRAVLDSVVLKDVVERYGIRSPSLLERILEFIADNIGSPTSARNIANYLRSIRIEASPQSVLDYLGYLTRSFALLRCPIENVGGKKVLEGIAKYYFQDLGLRSVVRNSTRSDISKIIENEVFIRLLADGWKVSTGRIGGRIGEREIDFIAEKGQKRCYIQATYLMPDEATRQREFGALAEIEGGWPRFVISMDPIVHDWQGIRHLRIRDFLREGLPVSE